MSHSQRVRSQDWRAALRLVREVYEGHSDALRRVQHAIAALCDLTNAQSGLVVVLEPHPDKPADMSLAQPGGAVDPDSLARYQRYAAGEYIVDCLYLTVQDCLTRPCVVRRATRVDDATWRRSPWYNEILRPMRLDDCMYAFSPLNHRYSVGLGLSRPLGAPPFSRREQLLVGAVHRELDGVYRQFAAELIDTADTLPGTLKTTLALLAKGLAEKEVARRRGLSRHTVHDHVKRLYRHYQVGSRAELLARVLGERGVLVNP